MHFFTMKKVYGHFLIFKNPKNIWTKWMSEMFVFSARKVFVFSLEYPENYTEECQKPYEESILLWFFFLICRIERLSNENLFCINLY